MVKARKQKSQEKASYWKVFAEYVLQGHNFKDAYLLARPQCAKWDPVAIRAQASQLAADPRVIAYQDAEVAKIAAKRKQREARLMTMLERREICRDVATAEESNGLTKLAAVKTDAQLAGEWLERQEVSSTVNLQALLAELPQSGLPVAQQVAPALPSAQPATLPDTGTATPALPSSTAQDWSLIDE